MIRYFCDRCGQETVSMRHRLTVQRTIITGVDKEVRTSSACHNEFCDDCITNAESQLYAVLSAKVTKIPEVADAKAV
jgi:hypothetical protein